MKKSLLYFLVGFIVILIDQAIKIVFFDRAILNEGIAFGLLEQNFLLISLLYVLAGGFLLGVFLKSKKTPIEYLGWSILVGGIVSNLIDRVRLGAIIDPFFIIDFLPAFNLADIAVMVGVLVIVLSRVKMRA